MRSWVELNEGLGRLHEGWVELYEGLGEELGGAS